VEDAGPNARAGRPRLPPFHVRVFPCFFASGARLRINFLRSCLGHRVFAKISRLVREPAGQRALPHRPTVARGATVKPDGARDAGAERPTRSLAARAQGVWPAAEFVSRDDAMTFAEAFWV